MTGANAYDGNLPDWNEIKSLHGWKSILLGNGASVAVWDDFRYSSLFDIAKNNQELTHQLSPEDIDLFQRLGTQNFETILGALLIAKQVNQALHIDLDEIDERHYSISCALGEAVRWAHVEWENVKDIRYIIGEELLRYDYIFSTNYDLLCYWSLMSQDTQKFTDFFIHGSFDRNFAHRINGKTRVYYLHGALHLYYKAFGDTHKNVNSNMGTLLEKFGVDLPEDAVPLLITEGTAKRKKESILQSGYLHYCFAEFEKHSAPLVVFGQGLGSTDAHLIEAMQQWNDQPLAIALVDHGASKNRSRKHSVRALFHKHDLLFFNAATHPLGAPVVHVAKS